MAITKYILPAVFAASTAYAADCKASKTTLSHPSDATALAACSTFTGNVIVESGATSSGTLDLGDIEKIDGDLTYENDNGVQTIKAGSLESVTGDLTFSNMSQLSNTGLSKLSSVGSLKFNGLQSLGQLGLDAGLEEAGLISIVNTVVSDLSGVQNVSKISGLDISDNPYLSSISLDVSDIGMINIGVNEEANGGQKASFLNLKTADSIIIRNSSSVDLPKLTNVTEILGLFGNVFTNFSAPKLGMCGGLVMNNNIKLLDISFPQLSIIKSGNATLEIANNTKLTQIDGFPKLKGVSGGVTFSGNFSKLNLDSIAQITGALNVDTASTSFDCGPVTDLKSKGVVKGKDNCRKADKSKIGGSGTGTSTGDDASASSSNFATPMEIPSDFMPIFTILAGLLSFIM